MTTRKFFYTLIGVEVIVLVVLVVLSMRGTASIGLCRYDLAHPFGYVTPADAQLMKILRSGAATTCPKGIFTAIYFVIYLLIITTSIYIIILLKRLFSRPKSETTAQE